jgi:hypothetical protein
MYPKNNIVDDKDFTDVVDLSMHSRIDKLSILPNNLRSQLKIEYLQENTISYEDIQILLSNNCETMERCHCAYSINFLKNDEIEKFLDFFYHEAEKTIDYRDVQTVDESACLLINRARLSSTMKTRFQKYLQKFEFIGRDNPQLSLNKHDMMQLCNYIDLPKSAKIAITNKIVIFLYDKLQSQGIFDYYFNRKSNEKIQSLKIPNLTKKRTVNE